MIIVGIDPGITGALACFVGGVLHDTVDMPVFDTRVDGSAVCALFDTWEPDVIYIEDVHAMPKNGSIASFKLGLNAGIVTGVIHALGISMRRVSPSVWKRSMGIRDKNAARQLVAEVYPAHANKVALVKHHGRADAVLIGRYGVFDQVRERNEQGQRVDGSADHDALRPDDGRDRHPASGASGDQREHPREADRGQGLAEVRPLVQPADPRRGADPDRAG
ncbi:MAG TPA: hypothetical protein VFX15_00310 [Actinomycetes bacterium]|nr:hypothetical protein [Actinomycetes bacterium]